MTTAAAPKEKICEVCRGVFPADVKSDVCDECFDMSLVFEGIATARAADDPRRDDYL